MDEVAPVTAGATRVNGFCLN